ncbi:ABC-2 transporter permease [Clostridium lundense]|uniref:ABC-2 transporter permease n=1 Tax=Clostridium lundense TaxID=319475 RepID=UPI000484073C|nr:ABC-2 transporter permease [Clostridium lundense]
MLNLIFKDIIVQKRNLLFMLLYLIICIFAFRSMPSQAILYVITLTYIFFFITGSYSYDEKNKSHLMISSLPITRKEIIISKYISIIIYNIVSLFVVFIFILLAKLLNLPLTTEFFTLNDVINIFTVSLILGSIMFPIYSKFTVTKSKLLTFIIYFSFFTFTSSLSSSSKENTVSITGRFLKLIFNNNLIFLAIVFIIYLLSMYVSIKIYESKELN